jgi:acetyltransferase-like isoleucine patch superfamily enzyme
MRASIFLAAMRDFFEGVARRAELLERARRSNASIGRNVEVIGLARLEIGAGTVIQSNTTLHCGAMDWCDGRGAIVIGTNVFIGHASVLYGAGSIMIGDDVLISPGVVIASHQHSHESSGIPMRLQPTRFGAVNIASNVWIGASATILPGVTIGEGAIVGAGAVVTHDVAPFELVVGIPAAPRPQRNTIRHVVTTDLGNECGS